MKIEEAVDYKTLRQRIAKLAAENDRLRTANARLSVKFSMLLVVLERVRGGNQ